MPRHVVISGGRPPPFRPAAEQYRADLSAGMGDGSGPVDFSLMNVFANIIPGVTVVGLVLAPLRPATTTVTPALIAAIARREEDDDVGVYVERHGFDGLAKALAYAAEYVDGTVNHRSMARELDLSPLEAEIILQALEPVAAVYRDTAA